ncbi:MAG: hypothetical protein GF334_03135 [Candidatus Altiarchaeales archaeon]|nr:hypothetical protein [Candidatus Altiarchaeales archaeon]
MQRGGDREGGFEEILKSLAENTDPQNLKGFPREIPPKKYMIDYLDWCGSETNTSPRNLAHINDPLLGRDVFLVRMGYDMHFRSAENLSAAMGHFRIMIPREKSLTFNFGEPHAAEDEVIRLVPPQGFLALSYKLSLPKNSQMKLFAGGDVSPHQSEKMGWMLSCMLADPSFDYSLVMPVPKLKYNRLKKAIAPLPD